MNDSLPYGPPMNTDIDYSSRVRIMAINKQRPYLLLYLVTHLHIRKCVYFTDVT